MERATFKSSTIFISVGDRTAVYRSLSEVPPKLRKKLQETTNGINAATILIADRNGRDEIVRAIQGMPNGMRSRVASSLLRSPKPKARRGLDPRVALEALLVAAVGLLIYLAFTYR